MPTKVIQEFDSWASIHWEKTRCLSSSDIRHSNVCSNTSPSTQQNESKSFKMHSFGLGRIHQRLPLLLSIHYNHLSRRQDWWIQVSSFKYHNYKKFSNFDLQQWTIKSKSIIKITTSQQVSFDPSFTNTTQNKFLTSPSLTPLRNASHTRSPKLIHFEISSAPIFSLAQTNNSTRPLRVLTHQIEQPTSQDGVKDVMHHSIWLKCPSI
jgi:hypothetical protein